MAIDKEKNTTRRSNSDEPQMKVKQVRMMGLVIHDEENPELEVTDKELMEVFNTRLDKKLAAEGLPPLVPVN